MSYTLAQCKKDMMEMWKWLSENRANSKLDFLINNRSFPNYLHNNCPCCEYTLYEVNRKYSSTFVPDCKRCPIDWGKSTCGQKGSPFHEYAYSEGEDRMKFARIIYELAANIVVEECDECQSKSAKETLSEKS
jgi:hypothetical protein